MNDAASFKKIEGSVALKNAPQPQRIGELLVNEGIITTNQVDVALEQQQRVGGRLVEHLISLKFLEPQRFLTFIAKNSGTASINLLNYAIPREVIQLVPAEFALAHDILPIDLLGPNLIIAMVCPLDTHTINELSVMTGFKVKPILVSMNDLHVALKRYHGAKVLEGGTVEGFLESERIIKSQRAVEEGQTSATPPKTVPKAQVIDHVLMPCVESGLHFGRIIHLVRQLKALPSLPESVRLVQEAMSNPDISVDDVAAIIQRDPALAAKMLSIANSSAYGLVYRVQTVELAVAMLGLREVFFLVLSSSVARFFEKAKHFDYRAFSRRSEFCGFVTRRILKACGEKGGSTGFASGLIHNLGQVALAQVIPHLYCELDHTLPDDELISVEETLFGVAHPEVGYLLAEEWELPPEIALPIRFHHRIDLAREQQTMVAAVGLASRLADAHWHAKGDDIHAWIEAGKAAADKLNLSHDQVMTIFSEVVAQMQEETSPVFLEDK